MHAIFKSVFKLMKNALILKHGVTYAIVHMLKK